MSTTSVPFPRAGPRRREPHLGLLATVEHAAREAVAPFDLDQELLTVFRLAHRARRDRERPFGPELHDLAPIAVEAVPDPRDCRGRRVPSASTPSPSRVIARDARPHDEACPRPRRATVSYSSRDRGRRRSRVSPYSATRLLARLRVARGDDCSGGEGASAARHEPEQASDRAARLADRRALHVEPSPRVGEPLGRAAEPLGAALRGRAGPRSGSTPRRFAPICSENAPLVAFCPPQPRARGSRHTSPPRARRGARERDPDRHDALR